MPIRPRPLRILATGVSVPDRVVESAELDARLGLPPGTIEARTGVVRRGVEPVRNAAQVAAEAARAALRGADLGLDAIDAVICANASPDQAMPCDAALLHCELGLARIPAFDVGASCIGFLMALDLAASLLAAGRYRRILLTSCDLASRALDANDPDSYGLFGDGAAAVVLDAGDDRGEDRDHGPALLSARFETWSEAAHACEISGCGSRLPPSRHAGDYRDVSTFRMDGKRLYRVAAEQFDRFVAEVLDDAGLGLDAIDRVVPHQASRLGMQHIFKRLGVPRERVEDLFADHGNQVSASLPTALHHALSSGRLHAGDTALLIGTAAGVTLGGAVLRL
ncbi:MAG: 3-oxoacyl-[acyl-carrier-protein] synthase III C-terminal domain-containing protein [Pseudomonadota bacterium]